MNVYHVDLHQHYLLVNKHNYGESPFLLGKLNISMAMFNTCVTKYQRDPEGKVSISLFTILVRLKKLLGPHRLRPAVSTYQL